MCVNVNLYVMWDICMFLKYLVCIIVYVLVLLKLIYLRMLNDFIIDILIDEKFIILLILFFEIMKKNFLILGGYEYICVIIEFFEYMKLIFLKYVFVGINWFNLV